MCKVHFSRCGCGVQQRDAVNSRIISRYFGFDFTRVLPLNSLFNRPFLQQSSRKLTESRSRNLFFLHKCLLVLIFLENRDEGSRSVRSSRDSFTSRFHIEIEGGKC